MRPRDWEDDLWVLSQHPTLFQALLVLHGLPLQADLPTARALLKLRMEKNEQRRFGIGLLIVSTIGFGSILFLLGYPSPASWVMSTGSLGMCLGALLAGWVLRGKATYENYIIQSLKPFLQQVREENVQS